MWELLEKIKNQKITISQWLLGFLGIIFVRFLLEALSSPTRSGLIPSNSETLIHYGLFWLAMTLGLSLVIGTLTKNFRGSANLALFGLPAIWIAPILDIFLSRGGGFVQSYIFDTGSKLVSDFLTFFGPSLSQGATYGVRIEMILVLICIGWYLYASEKKIWKTVIGIFSVYILGFVLGSWPGILYTLSHLYHTASTHSEILNYFGKIIFQSTISHNTLHEGILSVPATRFLELGFDKLASQILFLISCVFAGALLFKLNAKKFLVIAKNIRLERIGSYLVLLACGAGFAYIQNLGLPLTWIDTFGSACLILSWVSLWMSAVHENDLADVKIDEISNTDRPLVKKEISREDMREIGHLWLAVALVGAWCAGFYPFFMSLVYIAASYTYSAPPLRLRRFPLVSSFLIAIASLITILAGFFFISMDKQMQVFPTLLSIGIIIMVTLAINTKDLKDVEGDKADGILTLPILFGKHGPRIVGLCLALSFLLVPIFLSFYTLYIIALPASIIGYKLVTRNPYREEPIFILRFSFLAGVAILYLGIYWLAGMI